MKIVIVEDNIDLLQEMLFMLQHHGHSVRGATCGEEMDRHLAEEAADMVLLDVGLPGEDGFDIARRLHALNPAPGVVMLTARASVNDRVLGMQCGADHYLVKPVDRRELLAVLDRVHVRLQRGERVTSASGPQTAAAETPDGAGWTLDAAQLRILSPRGGTAELSARERVVLEALALAQGQPVARSALLAALGRSESVRDQRALEVKISRLRKKLRDINAGEAPLRAEWGSGYVFAERCRVIGR
jgi:DNA-binding response OmpR family regulator